MHSNHFYSPSSNSHYEDTCKLNEVQTIFHFLQHHVATASMVSAATGIKQKNICRYKRDLEKADMLWEIERKPCRITHFKAWYLTTDPGKATKRSNQLQFWGGNQNV